MGDYFFNLVMSFIPTALFLSFLVGTSLLVPSARKYKKKIFVGLLSVLIIVLGFKMMSSDITYKNTTNYDKKRDIESMIIKESYESKELHIEDKTLQPKLNEEERKNKFNELKEYKEKQ